MRKYLNGGHPAANADASDFGVFKPIEPAARREGMPLLGDDQVYVMKHGSDYHTGWCQIVADKWAHAPRGLLVTMVADVGVRARCLECDRAFDAARGPSARRYRVQVPPSPASPPRGAVIPLRVVGAAHGILFLAAAAEFKNRLRETAVEPATPLLVDGRRDGMLVRVDAAREEPLLVVQLDPRATFRDGLYQVRLRRPLQRSATKPYAVESVESAPWT